MPVFPLSVFFVVYTVTDNLCIVVDFRANAYIWMEIVCVRVMRWTDREEKERADGKVRREPGEKHRWRMSHVTRIWSGRQGLGLGPV